jgi:hypothetical protein
VDILNLLIAVAIVVVLAAIIVPAYRDQAARAKLLNRVTSQPVVVLFVITFAVVAFLNPAKVGLLLWGICKLAAFSFAGDWADARIFHDAQPEKLSGVEQGTAWKRKGWIVAAAIIAGSQLP